MSKAKVLYTNRELSWLDFNQRVLNEAADASVPPLDRLFFLSVTASNLDEFIMVRVGGLKLAVEHGIRKKDPAGMTPRQQLDAINGRVSAMISEQYKCYREAIVPALEAENIRHIAVQDLDVDQKEYAERLFRSEIFPVLSPMAVSRDQEFPLVQNLGVAIAVCLAPEKDGGEARFAVVPVPRNMRRFIFVPSSAKRYEYILLEDLMVSRIGDLFPGVRVHDTVQFRITRNADLVAREDIAPDFLAEMESVLRNRKTSSCIRMEVFGSALKETIAFLQNGFGVSGEDTFVAPGPLNLGGFSDMVFMEGFKHLRYPEWSPHPSAELDVSSSIFDEITKHEILLCHPFEDFEPVLKFLEEAADDASVIAIKQTLYRTSANSRIMAALKRAAEKGKHVTVVVELKARFDEARNIERARDLERAGAQVIYGIKNLKTHSKICLVVRREAVGIVRYVHFGTGNYNEKTARLYTDISFFTRDVDLGQDASTFMNMVTGYTEPQKFMKISSAPIGLRERLLDLIDGEAERCKQGQKALIMAKMNSLADPEIINALYRASNAGVKIMLNIRGICCLRAGVKGISDNISVVSIIDRFLEHSRIFYFLHGGAEKVFISSADWMPRNLDRRIELMVPVDNTRCRKKLMHILKVCMSDVNKGYFMQADGQYVRSDVRSEKNVSTRSQKIMFDEACAAADAANQAQRRVFEIHRPPSKG